MNRYRMQFAPAVWKPRLNATWVRWLRPWRLKHQRRVQQLVGMELRGAEPVRQALDAGHGVMIMPNHPSHADPFSIYMAGDELQTPLHIMATWHVFHGKPWITQRILQCHGCFSVDREANDIGAFRLAVDILENKPEPLVIFPEGEIYHCNDRVTPFRDGAAAIAVAAARRAKRKILCVPCALSYRYSEDPTPSLVELMGELEERVLWKRRTDLSLDERIYRFAEGLLALKEIEYFGTCRGGDLASRIVAFREDILQPIEQRLGLSPSDTVPERVKAARRTIMEKLRPVNDGDKKTTPEESVKLEDDLENLFLIVQSFSYPGDYVRQKPSVERLAETLDKFEEDVLQRATASIRAPRTVKIQFAEPIEVPVDRKNKELTSQLSRQVETAVQSLLEDIRGKSVMI